MRRAAGLLVATLAAGGAGVLVASPAEAAVLKGPTYTANTRTVTATIERGFGEDVEVVLSGPGGPDVSRTSSGFDPASVTVSRPDITINGRFRVVVTSSQAGGSRNGSVLVSAPPATPSGVIVTAGDAGVATVTWNGNIEPDLTGYEVLEDGAVLASVPKGCGPCSTTLTGLTPGQHAFAVRASRSDGDGGQVRASSAGVPVTVAAPAPPPTTEPPVDPGGPVDPGTPTEPGTPGDPGAPTTPGVPTNGSGAPVPGGGPSGGPSTSPTGTPTAAPSGTASPRPTLVTTPRRGTASFGGFSGFGTALSVPGLKLGVAPPTLAGGGTAAAEPDGTFDPELAYDSEIRETAVGAESGSNALGPIGDAIDSEQLMRTLAAALILLLAGAHLRRWLSDPGPTT